MFTGIIEEVGIIKSYTSDKIEIQCSKVLEGTQIGDSICVNGVCQTVISLSDSSFCARLSDTTKNISTFSDIKTGTPVNLERALTLSSRLGGHIVSGHIEGVGKVVKSEKLSEFFNIFIEIPQNLCKYIVKKGSITIDGISLTVADINNNTIMVSVIPHTFNNTNLKALPQYVNIETDILAKYVEKFLLTGNNTSNIVIDEKFLRDNGF